MAGLLWRACLTVAGRVVCQRASFLPLYTLTKSILQYGVPKISSVVPKPPLSLYSLLGFLGFLVRSVGQQMHGQDAGSPPPCTPAGSHIVVGPQRADVSEPRPPAPKILVGDPGCCRSAGGSTRRARAAAREPSLRWARATTLAHGLTAGMSRVVRSAPVPRLLSLLVVLACLTRLALESGMCLAQHHATTSLTSAVPCAASVARRQTVTKYQEPSAIC